MSSGLLVKPLTYLGRLTQVKSNVIMQVAAATVAPTVLLNNPFVKDKEIKEYSALQQIICAGISLCTQLMVALPTAKILEKLAVQNKIPYKSGSKELAAAQLVVGALSTLTTIPLYSYLVNKFLPKAKIQYKKWKNPEPDNSFPTAKQFFAKNPSSVAFQKNNTKGWIS